MTYTISQLETLYTEFLRAGSHINFFDYLRYLEEPKGKLMKDCEFTESLTVGDYAGGFRKVLSCNHSICTCVDSPTFSGKTTR